VNRNKIESASKNSVKEIQGKKRHKTEIAHSPRCKQPQNKCSTESDRSGNVGRHWPIQLMQVFWGQGKRRGWWWFEVGDGSRLVVVDDEGQDFAVGAD
jgi:hypothetical protein